MSILVLGCSQNHNRTNTTKSPADKLPESQASQIENKSSPTASNVKPAINSNSKALAAMVSSPENYSGQTKMAYMAAKQAPELMQKLFCYCGCDHIHDHLSLLDCFKDDHSDECRYCRGEAVMAFKMSKKGASLCEIQKAVDLNWGPYYLWWKEPSETARTYWKTRLWAPGKAPTVAEKHLEGDPKYDPFTETLDKFDKKVRSSSGNCCGGSKEAKAARDTKQ